MGTRKGLLRRAQGLRKWAQARDSRADLLLSRQEELSSQYREQLGNENATLRQQLERLKQERIQTKVGETLHSAALWAAAEQQHNYNPDNPDPYTTIGSPMEDDYNNAGTAGDP